MIIILFLYFVFANGEIIDIENQELNITETDINELNDTRAGLFPIYPGTKWCGIGNIAENENDLGIYKSIDKCCRTHDNCKDYIEPKSSKHGLYNDGITYIFHCKCEKALYNCLKSITNNANAIQIGNLYFNVVAGKCFKYTYPIKRCLLSVPHTFLRNRCILYQYNKNKSKKYQFIDLPMF